MKYLACLSLCLAVGCGAVSVPDLSKPKPAPAPQSLSIPALSAALATQAELASKDPSVDGSELIDGILTKGTEAGIPVSFSESVRKSCSGIGAKPSRDLRVDEIAAIRGVTQ